MEETKTAEIAGEKTVDNSHVGDADKPEIPKEEEQAPEPALSLEDVFPEEQFEPAEETGDGGPEQLEEKQEEENEIIQEKPKDYYRSQAEVDRAFKKRMESERKKWQEENAELLQMGRLINSLFDGKVDSMLEAQAKLLSETEDMPLAYAKRYIKDKMERIIQEQGIRPAQKKPEETAQ